MAVQIATEKSRGNFTVTVPVHPVFAESLRAAGIIGAEVFRTPVHAGGFWCDMRSAAGTSPAWAGRP
jgi:hypothetical protein